MDNFEFISLLTIWCCIIMKLRTSFFKLELSFLPSIKIGLFSICFVTSLRQKGDEQVSRQLFSKHWMPAIKLPLVWWDYDKKPVCVHYYTYSLLAKTRHKKPLWPKKVLFEKLYESPETCSVNLHKRFRLRSKVQVKI